MKNNLFKILIVVVMFFVIVSSITNSIIYRNYTRRVNDVILNIIGSIRYQYPEVTSEEILNILNSEILRSTRIREIWNK